MIADLLSGLIWQARMALRAGNARAHAAHGYVDNAYRPPRLPFVSVLGPLSFNVEPERETPRQASAPIRIPGHIIGRPRSAGDSVPGGGSLRLRFDGRVSVTLTALPGGSFGTAATGPAIASAIQAKLLAGAFEDTGGQPLTDTELVAAMKLLVCRWDPESKRLAIVSDAGIAKLEYLSRVEVLTVNNSIAAELGLTPPESTHDGRTILHRLPPPRAMTVDTRIELWASNQSDLAAMMDGLAQSVPTRGNLLTRPSLLLADAKQGDLEIRLLEEGEPTTLSSLFHMEAASGFEDRARGAVVTVDGATVESNPTRLHFTGTAHAAALVYPSPMVPSPLHQTNPAPNGLSVSFGLRLEAPNDNQSGRILDLDAGGTTVLRVTAETDRTGGVLYLILTGTATMQTAAGPAQASTVFPIPVERYTDRFGQVHVLVDGPSGTVQFFLDGVAQRLDDPPAPVTPVVARGTTSAASDMVLTVGSPGGSNLTYGTSHVHLYDTPQGPLDPHVRTSLVGASRVRPGDPIILARSDDGFRPGSVRFNALVVSVNGDKVSLSRAIDGPWARGKTLGFRDENFFYQTSIKRRDDLLNHIYRCCVDYRVSALIEDQRALATAALVERPEVDLIPRGGTRVAGGVPGVKAVITDNPTFRKVKKKDGEGEPQTQEPTQKPEPPQDQANK